MSSRLQYFRCFMSTSIPGLTPSLLYKESQNPANLTTLRNPRYTREKLTGGTGAFVRLCGLVRLGKSPLKLGVFGRSGRRYIVRGHLGTVRKCAYIVRDFIRIEPATVARWSERVAIKKWGSSDRRQVAPVRYTVSPFPS